MPTNRTTIRRRYRPPAFSAQALALFAELERCPRLKAGDPRERELAEMLGLLDEYFLSCCCLTEAARRRALR